MTQTNNMQIPEPTYNHTREDSPRYPCPICFRDDQPNKTGCTCKEMSCPEDCKNNHTHKTFYCEKCEPVYPPVPVHKTPGCTCTATHEGYCQDSRAETWEERFDEKFGKNGGYLCQYDGKATYTSVPEEVKSFIASEIQSAVEAERKKKTVTFKTTVDVEGYVERGREEECEIADN